MSELMVWFLLVQALSGFNFPSMQEGTRVQLVSPDLLTRYSEAEVINSQLIFETVLQPNTNVKLLISFEGTCTLPAVLESYEGTVSPAGDDILLYVGNPRTVVSLREFLDNERRIRLEIVMPEDG